MQAILVKIFNWVLPMLFNFLYKKANTWIEKEKVKKEENDKQGIVDEKNLKKLKEAETLEKSIRAAVDVYNSNHS